MHPSHLVLGLAFVVGACHHDPPAGTTSSRPLGPAASDAPWVSPAPLDSAPAPSACDPRFPRHLKDIQSVDDVPDGKALAMTADDAAARGLRCYAPGPHRAFNTSQWCCKAL